MAQEKIYDRTFKRMFKFSKRILIKFVNQVFKKEYSLDEEVIFLDGNTISENNDVLEKDIYFQICDERYLIEAQTYWDDMMFRLFEYATNSIEGNYERIDSSHAVFRIPQQAVVYLKDSKKENSKLYIKIIPPNGEPTEYTAEAIRVQGYTLQELVDNNMEILLPFQIIKMWRKAKDYLSFSDEKKGIFLADFEDMCYSIINLMDDLKKQNQITNDEYQQMLLVFYDLYKYIYGEIHDISEKGVDIMLNEKYVSSYDRALAEGAYERSLKIAENMLKANMSVVEIEKFTELQLVDIKPLAEKLGVNLVL